MTNSKDWEKKWVGRKRNTKHSTEIWLVKMGNSKLRTYCNIRNRNKTSKPHIIDVNCDAHLYSTTCRRQPPRRRSGSTEHRSHQIPFLTLLIPCILTKLFVTITNKWHIRTQSHSATTGFECKNALNTGTITVKDRTLVTVPQLQPTIAHNSHNSQQQYRGHLQHIHTLLQFTL